MNNILNEKLNEHLTGFIEYKWGEIMADVNLKNLTTKQLAVLKTIFHLGYQQGYEDNFQELKEAYKSDWAMLIDIFEESSLS